MIAIQALYVQCITIILSKHIICLRKAKMVKLNILVFYVHGKKYPM